MCLPDIMGPQPIEAETTIKVDCEAILELVTEDEVDLAILVAN